MPADSPTATAWAFPPDHVLHRIARESVLLVNGPSAVALQAAHPVVGQGVEAFSQFQSKPFARLIRTLDTVYRIVFGTVDEADQIREAMIARHTAIRGPDFSGMDPEAQFWVLATLMEGSIRAYETLIGPLTESEKNAYYRDMQQFGTYFGWTPNKAPADWDAFLAYYAERVAQPDLGRHPASREVIHALAHPRHPWYAVLLAPLTRAWLVEPLPAPLRQRLGLHSTRWTRGLWRLTTAMLRGLKYAPGLIRWVPHYRRMRTLLKRGTRLDS